VIGSSVQYLHPTLWRDWLHAGVDQLGYAAFWFAVVRIMFINFILSGDNAVVIAMACRGLPPLQQRLGLSVGVGVAVMLRVLFTGVLARLMLLDYVKLIGGVALLFIAARLLLPKSADRNASAQLWRAIAIVIVADIVMSLDNIIAVAAAAQGDVMLLGIGLVISIPLIVVGAALIAALLDRFPILIWAGAALLGWVAAEAIATDPALIRHLAAAVGGPLTGQFQFAAPATGAALALAAGGLWRRLQERRGGATGGAAGGA